MRTDVPSKNTRWVLCSVVFMLLQIIKTNIKFTFTKTSVVQTGVRILNTTANIQIKSHETLCTISHDTLGTVHCKTHNTQNIYSHEIQHYNRLNFFFFCVCQTAPKKIIPNSSSKSCQTLQCKNKWLENCPHNNNGIYRDDLADTATQSSTSRGKIVVWKNKHKRVRLQNRKEQLILQCSFCFDSLSDTTFLEVL